MQLLKNNKFKSLGYYEKQHSKYMTKIVSSNKFNACLYDVYGRDGQILYKAGDKPTTMYAWDWEVYQSDPTKLTDWSARHSNISIGTNIPNDMEIERIQEEQKTRRAQLKLMADTNWTTLNDEEMGKGMVAYTKLDEIVRNSSTLLWCMKAKRLNYYNVDGSINYNELERAGFQAELFEADKKSVAQAMESESAIQKENQGNPNN